MPKLQYKENMDATYPTTEGLKYIAHVCNNYGGWGAGFVLAISKRWDKPEKHYRNLNSTERRLGTTHFIKVESDIVVVNMVAQNGYKTKQYPTPLDYKALDKCLNVIYLNALENNATVHMPKIGTGLAGGDWNIIESLIKKNMTVDTYIYIL